MPPSLDDIADIAVIRAPPATARTLFETCVAFQGSSYDLVVYSPTAQQIVTCAWPTRNGTKIVPTGVREWLDNRGHHWGCFCGFQVPAGVYLSCRIVHASNAAREVFAFCHYEPSQCKFFMNLTRIYETTNKVSDYAHLPTVASGHRLNNWNNDNTQFLIDFALARLSKTEMGPFFIGYCGEAIPGVKQLSGAASPTRMKWINRRGKTSIRRSILPMQDPQPAMTAGPLGEAGRTLTTPEKPQALATHKGKAREKADDDFQSQGDQIDALLGGEGISEYEYARLFKKCDACKGYFLAYFANAHIDDCDGVIVV